MKARASTFASSLLAGTLLAIHASAGLSANVLFREPSLRDVVINPSGELIASVASRKSRQHVVVRRRDDAREVLAFRGQIGPRSLAWADDTHLVIAVGPSSFQVATVSVQEDDLVCDVQPIRVGGRFVDLLPNLGDEVLWSVGLWGETAVYRLSLSDLLQATTSTLTEADRHTRVADMKGSIDLWVADSGGVARAALRVGSTSRPSEIWYRESADDEWRLLLESENPDTHPRPLAMAANGVDLVVTAPSETGTLGLFELSAKTGEVGRELFFHPDADVTGIARDYSAGRVVGAFYQQDGLPEIHYFDSFYDRYQRSLEHALQGKITQIVSVSESRRYLVVLASSPRDPGTYYVLDTEKNVATRFGRVMPWIDPNDLAEVRALRVASNDDTEIEAFVALPRSARDKPPLVVLPHGGPIGVRDTRTFDPVVQYLAAGGIAVLQVNYRGSAGRGKTFTDAGRRQWGSGIEEDLEAAVDEVVERGWVDGDRVCIAGGSYGGYSALISAIRHPDRYRCAASLNGPTDLQFAYHSFFKHWKSGREYFEEFVGDPEDPEALRAISPTYLADRIRAPILLVHGTHDRRVDVDHYYRMKAVLEGLGKQPETYLIQNGRHWLTRFQRIDYLGRLRAFLIRNLVLHQPPAHEA